MDLATVSGDAKRKALADGADPESPRAFLERQHRLLSERFSALSAARQGKPVYAIEHGLSADEVERLRRAIGVRLRGRPMEALEPHTLPMIVVATETGYAYNGLWTGYWPLLGSSAGLDLGTAARARLSEWFDVASRKHGIKRPNDTPFARTFRHIAWPIANALAPRQIHAAIATMLRDVAVLAEFLDEGEFVRQLRGAAARSGSDRLVEWSADETRLLLLADAILRPESERSDLSPGVVERLLKDMEAVPGAGAHVAEARRILVRQMPAAKPARLVIVPAVDGSFSLALQREDHLRDDRRADAAVSVPSLAAVEDVAKAAGLALRGGRSDTRVFMRAGDVFVSWANADGPVDPAAELAVLAAEAWDKDEALSLMGSCAGGELYRVASNGPARDDLLDRLGVEHRGTVVSVAGGLRLGFGRRFVSGIPIRVGRGTETSSGATLDFASSGKVVLDPDETLVIGGAPGVDVDIVAAELGSAVARVSFADAAVAEPAVTVRVDPPEPTVRDFAEGRVSIDLAGRRRFKVPVRVTLFVPGEARVVSDLVAGLPRRLSAADGLTAQVDAVRALPRRPTSARLVVDYSVDRIDLTLTEPTHAIAFHNEDGAWRALRTEEGEEFEAPFRVFEASEPFAPGSAPRLSEPASAATFRLLVPEETGAPGLLVGPRAIQGAAPAVAMPEPHRRLRRTAEGPGLEDEIAAWLRFRGADAEHPLAAAVARTVAECAERAVVTTLCGEAWAMREGAGLPGAAAALIEAALASRYDPFRVKLIPEADLPEVDAFRRELEPRFVAVAGLETAVAGGGVSTSVAEALDLAAEEAWLAVDDDRARRGLPPLNLVPAAAEEDWAKICAKAKALVERRDLVAMIVPRPLGDALLAIPYHESASADVAREIDRHRKDFGSLRRSGKRLSADAIDDALNLYLRPSAFARTAWSTLAACLLEDRMTSRAVRYAALRLRATTGA